MTSTHVGTAPWLRPVAAMADAVLGPRGCLFTFHRAAPSAIWPTLPNRNFYLDLGFLDRLLSYLARQGWAVVTLREALRRAAEAQPGDRYVNFSIDDCYRDTFEHVVPLFRSHGVPLTLFVTTGIPDGTLPMWGAGLEEVLLRQDRVTLADGPIAVATSDAKRAAYARIAAVWDGPDAARHYAGFCRLNNADAQALHAKHAMSWDMLEAVRDDPLVEIGAHTLTHARISTLTPEAARAEVAGSRQRLQDRLGVAARHFAFPYGRRADCGPRDFALAAQSGFASASTTRKGLVRRGQDIFSLPRNTLNGAHKSMGFVEAHLLGLTGAAARMLGRV